MPASLSSTVRAAGRVRTAAGSGLACGLLLAALALGGTPARAAYLIELAGTLGGMGTEAVGVNDQGQLAGTLTGT